MPLSSVVFLRDTIDLETAARMAHVSVARMRRYCETGRVVADWDGEWHVNRPALIEWVMRGGDWSAGVLDTLAFLLVVCSLILLLSLWAD